MAARAIPHATVEAALASGSIARLVSRVHRSYLRERAVMYINVASQCLQSGASVETCKDIGILVQAPPRKPQHNFFLARSPMGWALEEESAGAAPANPWWGAGLFQVYNPSITNIYIYIHIYMYVM